MNQQIFRGTGEAHSWELPSPPPWRRFEGQAVTAAFGTDWEQQRLNDLERARSYRADAHEIELVNIAILLRRPLLITGRPGTGKSTLAYAIAHELQLGPVLHWPITSRSTLQDGLYRYDAIARLQDSNLPLEERPARGIGQYVQLGPLGTALLPTEKPRVVLIDEVDKGDIDLPNDLLTVLEEGEFAIPELQRIAERQPEVQVNVDRAAGTAGVRTGLVRCRAFPIVIMTSNGEREFPPAFLRRCLQLDIPEPGPERLAAIVQAHLGDGAMAEANDLITEFLARRSIGEMATDQLLNALFFTMNSSDLPDTERARLVGSIMRQLNAPPA